MHFFFLLKRKPALKEKIISLVKLFKNIHIAFVALPTAFSFANTIPFMSLQMISSTILLNVPSASEVRQRLDLGGVPWARSQIRPVK